MRITVRRKVCSCKPVEVRPSSKGSLIFVIDDTGSMGSVINSVRSNILSILAANKIFKNYVIATYGDPYRKNVLETTNADEVRSFLSRVRPHGGGDCPEFALSGVLDAARKAKDNSVLFLFTDASAKDARMQDDVAKELASRKIRFFTVSSGNLCGTPGNEYSRIASATGGRLAKLNAGDTASVMAFIRKAVAGELSFGVFPGSRAEMSKVLSGDCGCRTVPGYRCVGTGLVMPPETSESETGWESHVERLCVDPYNSKRYKPGQVWMTKADDMCLHFKCSTEPGSSRPFRSDCLSADGSCVRASAAGAPFDCKVDGSVSKCQCKKSDDGSVFITRMVSYVTEA